MRRLCTICARAGSKGIKNKNIKELAGKPLIIHTIEQAQKSNLFDCVAVSSDSDGILEIAKKWGINYLIKRPAELASDTAAKIPVIKHCVLEVEKQTQTKFDTIVDLDVTSPLREVEDIKNAVNLLEQEKVSNVITGMPSRRSPYFNIVESDKNGVVRLSKPLDKRITRRQDAPKSYDMNASIYVWNRDSLFLNDTIFKDDTLLYVMPEERSIDIDSELDFEFVEFLIRKKKEKQLMREISFKKLFDLKGKTAIVTGGAGILGTQFCKGLAEFGANVVVVDLRSDECYKLAYELETNYICRAMGIVCDVSSPDSVTSMIKEVIKKFGEINILVNNAATKGSDLKACFAPFEKYNLETWREVMSVNLEGMFLVAQAVGNQMADQNRGGSIIQISSVYGILGPDNRIYEDSFYLGTQINTPAVYSASKAAVIGLTKYLATYWANKGIRVNAITPGGVESGQNNEFINKYSNRVPMGRMARRHEMVGALLYLASDASSYVTGQNIVIDGGLSVW